MPADTSVFYGLRTKPLLALNLHYLSQRDPLIWLRPSVSNHEVSCALVTGGVTRFVFSGDGVSKIGSAVCATGDTEDTVDPRDTGVDTSVPSNLGMRVDLIRTACCRAITEATGEAGE